MAMKVILLKDIRGVGQHGEVKDVSDGYASNALFPKHLAEAATPQRIAQIESQKSAHEAELKKVEEQLNNKVDSLRGKKVVISSRATEKGGLFKAATVKDIAKAILAEHSLEIPEASIELSQPIKTTGEHTVKLHSKTKNSDLVVSVVAA